MAPEDTDDATGPAGAIDRPERLEDALYAREEYVLYCLSRHGRVAIPDLAEAIAVWESGVDLPELPPSEVRTAHLSLLHTHVPRLERLGLVDHAEKRGILRLSPAARRLDPRKPPREHTPRRSPSVEP